MLSAEQGGGGGGVGTGETGAGGGGKEPASDSRELAEAARGGGRSARLLSS